jgi:hypothetical protein
VIQKRAPAAAHRISERLGDLEGGQEVGDLGGPPLSVRPRLDARHHPQRHRRLVGRLDALDGFAGQHRAVAPLDPVVREGERTRGRERGAGTHRERLGDPVEDQRRRQSSLSLSRR